MAFGLENSTYPRVMVLDSSYEEFKKLKGIPMRVKTHEFFSDPVHINLESDDWSDLKVKLTKEDLRKFLHYAFIVNFPGVYSEVDTSDPNDRKVEFLLGGTMIYALDISKLLVGNTSNYIYSGTGDLTKDLVLNYVYIAKNDIMENLKQFRLQVKSVDLGGKVMQEVPLNMDDMNDVIDDLYVLMQNFANPGSLSEPYESHILLTGHYETGGSGQNVFVPEKAYFLPGHIVVYNKAQDESATYVLAVVNIKPDVTRELNFDSFKVCDSNEIELSVKYDKDYVDVMDKVIIPRPLVGTELYEEGKISFKEVAVKFVAVVSDAYKL